MRARTDRPTDRPGLLNSMRAFLRSIQRRPDRVSTYFHTDTCRYAAAC